MEDRRTLAKQLGVVVQLGHMNPLPCTRSRQSKFETMFQTKSRKRFPVPESDRISKQYSF